MAPSLYGRGAAKLKSGDVTAAMKDLAAAKMDPDIVRKNVRPHLTEHMPTGGTATLGRLPI